MSALLHRHGLVMLGIERLAVRIQLLQLMTGQGVEQQLEGKLDAFAHRLDRLVIRVRQLETALQAVGDGQQVTGELFQRELVRLFDILLGTPTDVLQLCRHAQRLILRGRQLLLQRLHAGCQILGYVCLRLLWRFRVLVIQVLLVGHGSSSQYDQRAASPRLCRYMGARKPASRVCGDVQRAK